MNQFMIKVTNTYIEICTSGTWTNLIPVVDFLTKSSRFLYFLQVCYLIAEILNLHPIVKDVNIQGNFSPIKFTF